MNFRFKLIAISILLSISSCSQMTKEDKIWYDVVKSGRENKKELCWENFEASMGNVVGKYNAEYGLLCRSAEEYDIKAVIEVDHYNFEFFNYCNELQINKSVIPNIFTKHVATNKSLLVINFEDVSTFTPLFSEKNGIWGYANIRNYELGLSLNDIFVTPLAAKYLQSRHIKDSGSLIFVRFEQKSGTEYKDYLFYGDYNVAYLINSCYDKINTQTTSALNDNSTNSNWKVKR